MSLHKMLKKLHNQQTQLIEKLDEAQSLNLHFRKVIERKNREIAELKQQLKEEHNVTVTYTDPDIKW